MRFTPIIVLLLARSMVVSQLLLSFVCLMSEHEDCSDWLPCIRKVYIGL